MFLWKWFTTNFVSFRFIFLECRINKYISSSTVIAWAWFNESTPFDIMNVIFLVAVNVRSSSGSRNSSTLISTKGNSLSSFALVMSSILLRKRILFFWSIFIDFNFDFVKKQSWFLIYSIKILFYFWYCKVQENLHFHFESHLLQVQLLSCQEILSLQNSVLFYDCFFFSF